MKQARKAVAQPVDAVAERATIKAAEREAVTTRAAEARANAFPPFPSDADVSADTYGWRYGGARVVKDDGPASNGERRITLERIKGPRSGETVEVRRERVRLSRDRN